MHPSRAMIVAMSEKAMRAIAAGSILIGAAVISLILWAAFFILMVPGVPGD